MNDTILGQEDQFDEATIGDLRALVKGYGITADRTWKRADFVRVILEEQAKGNSPVLVSEDTQAEADRLIANYSLPQSRTAGAADKGAPKPGYARVILHKDPTPGHANSHVPVGLNGRIQLVPRGVPVDLPIEYLGVLHDAVHLVRKQVREPDAQNLDGVVEEEKILSYPYQIVSLTPGGKFTNVNDQRSAGAARRKAFHTALQRWPTDGELQEWEKTNNAAQAYKNMKD